jgi:hypothetical protein
MLALLAIGVGEAPSRIEHVVMVSVDGLRPECIAAPIAASYPALARLARGPHTLQARCDPQISVTLPNHIDMITGRTVAGAAGHGWIANDDPPSRKHGGTLHARNDGYVSSVFDVAHDQGLSTALICGKWKFVLFEQTYGEDAGGPDTLAPDNGRDKLDLFVCDPGPMSQADHTFTFLRDATLQGKRSVAFLHLPTPDFAGHASGWDLADGSPYRKGVADADGVLARLLAAIEADASLRGKVAIVLTADHGGGVPRISHVDAEAPINFTIPFLVWLGRDGESLDLYQLNRDTRRQPAPSERFAADGPPPIRNAELGNVALSILGLPGIPGSTANAAQDLRLQAPAQPVAETGASTSKTASP